ncbi:TetR/AcrR family transcriptional regulator [Microbispora triticiradicis]|uniref:TetR/AcrR family transcriptional regulator n=1 Tax=Microbispora triticiradicis TaxID=2200763 RepID=UPI001AD7A498|nr:TetR family transcriptional regulator [Microbispora triticiradicis]MBO4270311.1 TetR family transcriptional regulator [Microbispora triticiradicis]
MPPRRDVKDPTAATKAALLEAARAEFAAYGVAGARVDRIADRAGVNKERIYGHFGSKEKLFDTVVAAALDEMAEAVAMPGDDPADYVSRLFDYYAAHPDVVRLMMWEALHYRSEDALLPGQERRVDKCRSKTVSLAAGLGREPDAAMARTLFTLIGMAMWPSAMPQLARITAGEDATTPEGREALRGHLMAFVRAAVRD